MSYAIRVSRPYVDLVTFFQKVKEVTRWVIVYQHDADEDISRDHVHAYLEGCNTSTDTMKRWIKECLNVTNFPKTDWSFKSNANRDFITYMSKGKLDPVYTSCDVKLLIDGYKSRWVEHEQPSGKTDTEVTCYQMAEELAKWIDRSGIEYDSTKGQWCSGEEDSERDVVLQCIKIHNKYRKGYCDFSLVRVVQTAYGLCSKTRFKDALVAKVLEKLSPRI